MTTELNSSRMILAMGLPRSGTTWVGKIFDSHPSVFYSHEPDSARPLREIPLFLPVEKTSEYRGALIREVETLRRIRSTRVVGKLPLFPKTHTRLASNGLREKELLLFKLLSRGFSELSVPRHVCGDLESAPFWVWKSIESTGRLGALARVLPVSRVVFIIRHPCGVVASVARGEAASRFSAGPSSDDVGFFELLSGTEAARSRDMGVETFLNMTSVERMAWRWALWNEQTLRDIGGLPNCMVLRYEDLCEEPERTARRLFEFGGLDWSSQTEQFISQSTSRTDESYYAVFKDPVTAANKWKKELPPPIIAEVLRIAGRTELGAFYQE